MQTLVDLILKLYVLFDSTIFKMSSEPAASAFWEDMPEMQILGSYYRPKNEKPGGGDW
jgi:hypothetical protein